MAEAAGWSTIESDEGVFTSLIESLGVKDAQFEELISLDADTIRSLSPVYGVIFLFKWTRAQTQSLTPSTPQDGTYDPAAADSDAVFFASQTIQNACGTQAVLSVIFNQDKNTNTDTTSSSSKGIDIGPDLASFKDFTAGFPPDLRGEALSNSESIRTAHNAFAKASPFVDETARTGDEDPADVFHFIAYVPVNGVLYELDGLQPHPINHGACSMDGDGDGKGEAFADKVIGVIQRRIARYPEGETRFNLMAVVRDLRVRAAEIGDQEMLEREERKRRQWAWENTLRRSNFVGFIGEVAKGVVGHKESTGEYQDWVEKAKGETKKKLELRREL